jgi:hypothetical protein
MSRQCWFWKFLRLVVKKVITITKTIAEAGYHLHEKLEAGKLTINKKKLLFMDREIWFQLVRLLTHFHTFNRKFSISKRLLISW